MSQGEGWPRGGVGNGGGGADGRGATRAVGCAGEGRDRAPALEGRGAGHRVARDAGAGAPSGGGGSSSWGDQWVQAAGHAGGGAGAQAHAGEGRRADDEARERGVVPGKKGSSPKSV